MVSKSVDFVRQISLCFVMLLWAYLLWSSQHPLSLPQQNFYDSVKVLWGNFSCGLREEWKALKGWVSGQLSQSVSAVSGWDVPQSFQSCFLLSCGSWDECGWKDSLIQGSRTGWLHVGFWSMTAIYHGKKYPVSQSRTSRAKISSEFPTLYLNEDFLRNIFGGQQVGVAATKLRANPLVFLSSP